MTTFLREYAGPAIGMLLALTVITGAAYPALITAVAQLAFTSQANGSFVTTADGRTIGSSLIGQCFSGDSYFWGRPSAAGATDANPCGYDGTASAGSNLGPTSQALLDRIASDVDRLKAANGDGPIPVDLVTTSASGLDANISPVAAEYQLARVAKARGMSAAEVQAVVTRHTRQPFFGFLGEPVVNVLEVNLDLDGLLR